MPRNPFEPKEHLDPHSFDKAPRNGPCICGSGKKFKRCCLSRIYQPDPFDVDSTSESLAEWAKRHPLVVEPPKVADSTK